MSYARAALALAVALSGCSASSSALREGREAARSGRLDAAVALFEQALEERPGDVEIRIALTEARLEAAHFHLDEARRHLDGGAVGRAVPELRRSLELDPTNRYAREELEEAQRRLADEEEGETAASAARAREPLISLTFEDTSLREVLETLADLAGVDLLFDEAYRDERVSVKLEGVTFTQALDLLTSTHGLFYTLDRSTNGKEGQALIAR